MKTKTLSIAIALVTIVALAAPLGASARRPNDSRHPNPHGPQGDRNHPPQGRSKPYGRTYWSVPPPRPPPVMVYPGYYYPPPPPPYWSYYPPPPPPVYVYPRCYRPGLNVVLSF